MMPLSIFSTNLLSENLLLLASLLVIVAVLVTKVGSKLGAPSLLLFLLLGMAVGSDGLGLHFEDYELAESIGHFAMTIILFSAGLETSLPETKPVLRQGALLSTVGVLLTVILTGVFIWRLHLAHRRTCRRLPDPGLFPDSGRDGLDGFRFRVFRPAGEKTPSAREPGTHAGAGVRKQ